MNLLALEPLILARLAATVQNAEITSVASIAGAIDITRRLPLIFIQPAAADAADVRGDGRAALDVQRWVVFVITQAVPDKRYLEANYQDAGELLGQVFVSLAGWSAGPGYGPMKYAGRLEPHIELGSAAFPVAFDCSVTLINT